MSNAKAQSAGEVVAADAEEESSPVFRLVLWGALAASMFLLFLSVVSAPLALQAMWGFTGGSSVKIWSIICAVCALSIALEYVGRRPGPEGALRWNRNDVWAQYVLFLVFLGVLNYFVHVTYTRSPQGLMYGHDAPQYYMQLHSLAIDRDVDFSNEYDLLPRVKDNMARWRPLDIGTDYNVAPVGTAMVWMPFYLAAFPCVYLLKAAGLSASLDGVSSPFAMAAGYGSGFLAWIGMILIYDALRRWFSYRTALATALLTYGATNLLWYLTGEAWMSHAASFFTAAVVLWLWVRTAEHRTWRGWLAFGAAIGLAMLVRPSHVALVVLPLADAAAALVKRVKVATVLTGVALSAAGMLVVFSVQLMTWFVRSGVGTPPGNPILWTEPAILQILFSSHNGLISWHPVTLLGFLGVPLLWRHSRVLCLSVALVLALQVYFNAGILDWSGGGSFGMRRFIGTLPFLAPGTAVLGSWVVGAMRRRPLILATAGIALASIYNSALMVGHKDVLFPENAPVPFAHAWSISGVVIQETFGHPFSFPANYLFANRNGLSATQYDLLSSNRAYGRPIDVSGMVMNMYLGEGWEFKLRHQLEEGGYATARSGECHIVLPLRDKGAYRVEIEIAAPPGLPAPQTMKVYLNGEQLGETPLRQDAWNTIGFDVKRGVAKLGLNDLKLTFELSKETPYVANPPNEKSVLQFSREVKARYQASRTYWAVLRHLKVTPKDVAGQKKKPSLGNVTVPADEPAQAPADSADDDGPN